MSGGSDRAADRGLGRAAVRDLAARHGVRPSKSLGQNFLCDPNLARAIAAEAGVGTGDRVVEVGAGFGSLTVALAATGAEVLAMEFDRKLIPALEEVVGELPSVRVLHADAMKVDWASTLSAGGESGGSWTMVSNLPYNIATPLVLEMLERAPTVERFLVMIQREVGERLAAGPGEEAYGAVSVRVAFLATASVVRRVPPAVFWPEPAVESVLVRLERLERSPVEVPSAAALRRVIEAGFGQRRKTMRNALRRLGLSMERADAVLASCSLDPRVRAETLGLESFAAIARALEDEG